MRHLALVVAGLLVLHTGCGGTKCASGTFTMGDECVGFDPNDKTPPSTTITPSGGRSRNPLPMLVMLQVDDPQALIYYTTDGSDPDPSTQTGHREQTAIIGVTNKETIKFLSVDLAGNREAVQSATFESDTTPPAAVTNLTVTMVGTTAQVRWTNPTDADYSGTLIARVGDIVDGGPLPGQLPTVGGNLTTSLQIASTGASTSFDDSGRQPGPARYVAWTYDDLGNYSLPVIAGTNVPLGALGATFTYDTTAANLTMTAPANLDLTGTTATYDNTGSTVTLHLSVTNKTAKYLLNPKLEITSVTGSTGAAISNSDGNAVEGASTYPFRTLGPNALAPGVTVTRDVVFSSVNPGSTLVVGGTFATHPSLLVTSGTAPFSYSLKLGPAVGQFDLASGQGLAPFATVTQGPNNRIGGQIRLPALIGGHYLDVPTTHASIERFDLATGQRVSTLLLGTGDRANVQGVLSVPQGELAVLKHAGKNGNTSIGALELVILDEGQHVLSRTMLPFNDGQGYCSPVVSPDGTTIAIAANDGVLLLDAHTLAPIDADPTTPDPDVFLSGLTDYSGTNPGRVGSMAFFGATNNLFVLGKTRGQGNVIKRAADGTYTATNVLNDSSYSAYSAALGPDGNIYIGGSSSVAGTSLRTYNPATDAITPVAAYTTTSNGIASAAGQLWIIHSDRGGLDQFDTGTMTIKRTFTVPVVNYPGGTTVCSPYCDGIYGHWIGLAQ